MASSRLGRFQPIVNDEAPVLSLVANGVREDVVAGLEASTDGAYGENTEEIEEVRSWVREQFGNRYAISWVGHSNLPEVYRQYAPWRVDIKIQFWFARHEDAVAFRIRWG